MLLVTEMRAALANVGTGHMLCNIYVHMWEGACQSMQTDNPAPMHARTHTRTYTRHTMFKPATLTCTPSCCAPFGLENASTTCCFTLPSSSTTRNVNRRSNRPLLSVAVGPAALALLLLLLLTSASCSSATAAAADARVTGLQHHKGVDVRG